jgi:hypothetical protein
MPKKKNVLILPDGFDGGAQAEFEFYARELVQRLGSEAQTRPHDLLKTKFNFFTAWVPSPQSDISVLTELMRQTYTGPKLPPGSPPAFDGDTFDPAVAGAIQLLVNERDTAFHAAFGTRPDDSFLGSQDYPGFNPLRIDTDDFNAFLHHVTSKPSDPSHIPEGRTWTKGGNDEKLILVLCRSTHLGGVNGFWTDTSRMMFVALQSEKVHHITPNAGGKGYETIVSTPDPAKAKLATWLTVAHELGHSLRLGDEYGKKKPPIKVFELPQIERWGNVQLLTSFTNKILSGDEIKWNWPRMAKAAAYKSLSQPNTQGIITLELAGSYAEQSCKPDKIRQGDFVRLRLRNIFFDDTISDELEVVSVEEFAIKVKALIGAPLPGQPFRGSIGSGPPGVVFVIATDKAGDDANLVHSAIRAHINAEHHPLDAPPGAGWTCDDTKNKFSGTPHVPPAPTPPVKWPANLDWIVGLYDGGGAYRCETYHPSSECMMLDDDNGKPFCQVCRYLLVDQIDPLKHGAIDRDFAPNYPK